MGDKGIGTPSQVAEIAAARSHGRVAQAGAAFTMRAAAISKTNTNYQHAMLLVLETTSGDFAALHLHHTQRPLSPRCSRTSPQHSAERSQISDSQDELKHRNTTVQGSIYKRSPQRTTHKQCAGSSRIMQVRGTAAGAPHAFDGSEASYDSSGVRRVTSSKSHLASSSTVGNKV